MIGMQYASAPAETSLRPGQLGGLLNVPSAQLLTPEKGRQSSTASAGVENGQRHALIAEVADCYLRLINTLPPYYLRSQRNKEYEM